MKNKLNLVIIVLSTIFINNVFAGGCSDSEADMVIRPVNHPNACVALELKNLASHTGNRNWEFDPAVGGVPIDASTGLTLTPNPYPLAQGATKTVYWTTSGDKRFRYNGGSWERFHSCNCNPIAADLFEHAPLICNTNLYCGTTSSAYGVDQTGPLECNGGADHSGSLENNSWLRFIAAGTTASFNINVLGGCYIQFAVYAYNPAAADNGKFVLMTDIDWTDIDVGFTGSNTIIANGLVPGNQYYLHFDGHGGAECNYEIGFNSGFAQADLTVSDNLICVGETVTLTATPYDPSALYSWSINGGAPFTAGNTMNVSPVVNSTYEVDILLTGCDNTAQSISVNIDPCPLPVELASLEAQAEENFNEITWTTASENNSSYFLLERSSDLQNWEKVNQVASAGNSNGMLRYFALDYAFENTINYYRLTQVDIDGAYKIYDVVSVDNTLNNKAIDKVFNLMGQEVSIDTPGAKIILYKDGSSKKVMD